MYLLAIVLPPVVIVFSGKPFQAFLNLLLCILRYISGIIHAILVVNDHKANKRMLKQAELIKKSYKLIRKGLSKR
ncbi:MAG: YqaE/Pmp3 family membrane protein [Psychrobacillus psychrodurans]